MSLSALKGALGVGIQSAKGAAAGTIVYFPAMNASVTGEQLSQTIPPEVGGAFFARGAYKAAIRGRGELAIAPRPVSIGYLIRSLFNKEVLGSPVSGLTPHVFTVGDDAAHPHVWMSAVRQVSGAYGEQLMDSRVGTFRLDIAAASLVNASVAMIGGQHGEVAGDDIFVEDEAVFLSCVTDITAGGAPFIVDRVSMEIGAQLTDNEFRVGSYFLDDITMLQRAVQLTLDVRIKSRDLFAKVYRNGAVAPTGSNIGSWSPTIYRTAMNMVLRTSETIPQTLEIDLPGVDFMTLPVGLAGAELVRAQLTAMVTLGSDNNAEDGSLQPITLTLTNTRSTLYDA